MSAHAHILADFRSQVSRLLQEREEQWEASRRLVGAGQLPVTLKRLIEEVRRVELPAAVRDTITTALTAGHIERAQDLPGPRLKELTGLPPTKAVRALCVWFDLVERPSFAWHRTALPANAVDFLHQPNANPFELLLTLEAPSLFEVGAGDLSLATETVERYAPAIRRRGKTLIVHSLDRLHPESKLGGPLHPDRLCLESLRSRPDLSFQFFGNQDMFALDRLDRSGKLAPQYSIAACWAPATPTFAYEPARLNAAVIEHDLNRTRGASHRIDYGGEPALEVLHGDRALIFPPWKFEIRGPLALLELLSRRGQVCVLGAVDTQVFWEILAQLIEDDRYRPVDQPFTFDNIRPIFGNIYELLNKLTAHDSVNLQDHVPLRRQLPRVLGLDGVSTDHFGFHSVQIRRGAEFPDMPASSTARRFRDMVEETSPWMLTLIPDI
ncbi:hypothetical protein W02_26020 [Nitrospira sp. KM1]|uniref:hypothetical protein n=1 Tax=Nitrospira sp. KM1 TaxID=1936990 RepID=UPI0013A7B57B|nr:hypothetical protein [Nitrospira sp. KM1]BCA55462.1 hypothetical protein W02_26020 [Nitrospira sp. KM1]